MSKEAIQGAFYGSLIADSLAMPAHWFYDVPQIKEVYGNWISDYVAPKNEHRGCGLGQGHPVPPIIGTVILHDTAHFWKSAPKGTHYHQGMAAGDNLLNSVCAVNVAKSLKSVDPERKCSNWDEVAAAVFENYVALLTTPGSHNDTWPEGYVRDLFTAWVDAGSPKDGKSILEFLKNRRDSCFAEGEKTGYHMAGGTVMAIPWILHYSNQSLEKCQEIVWKFVSLTHPSIGFKPYIDLATSSVYQAVYGTSVKEIAEKALKSEVLENAPNKVDYDSFRKQLHSEENKEKRLEILQAMAKEAGLDCTIYKALKIAFFLAAEYENDFSAGVLANVNVGGENCHRAAVLGALLGAASVKSEKKIPQNWKENLKQYPAVKTIAGA